MACPVLLITMTAPHEGAAPSSSPVDQWMKRLQEAHRLVDEVTERDKIHVPVQHTGINLVIKNNSSSSSSTCINFLIFSFRAHCLKDANRNKLR